MAWKQKAYFCAELDSIKGAELEAPEQLASRFKDPNFKIGNVHDALVCLLNVLVTEAHFECRTSYSEWKKRFFYSIQYTHYTTNGTIFQLKYLPLEKSDTVQIFATVDNRQVSKLSLQCKQYIKDHNEKVPKKVYKNIRALNNTFKDAIVWKMLAEAQDYPTCGLLALPTEVKLQILYKMCFPELGRLSTASKEFNDLVQDSSVWKYLLLRDYPKLDHQSTEDIKAVYKDEFLRIRKERKKEESYKEYLKSREKESRMQMSRDYCDSRPFPARYPETRPRLTDEIFGWPGQRLRSYPKRDLAHVNFKRF